MIVGHGIDIASIPRIERSLGRFAERFLQRCFTRSEQGYALSRRRPATHLAGRFAAKEAVLKALGTGWRSGIAWTDIEIVACDVVLGCVSALGRSTGRLCRRRFGFALFAAGLLLRVRLAVRALLVLLGRHLVRLGAVVGLVEAGALEYDSGAGADESIQLQLPALGALAPGAPLDAKALGEPLRSFL